jgi:mannose/fructose/N-acetylgalactosamine-specific phosphotransferase system component IIC
MSVFAMSIIGSIIMLDKYAFGEFGVSQPIVAGTIIGAFYGDLVTGIFLAAMLQLIFLGGLPIGRDIPPDGQAAGIVGCGSYFLLRISNAPEHALFLALVMALIASLIGGVMEIYTRQFNEKLARLIMKRKDCLYVYHLFGLITSFVRTFCLFLPLFIIMSSIRIPSFMPTLSRELLMIIGISIGIANGIYLFVKKTTIVYAIVGGLCGLALVVF